MDGWMHGCMGAWVRGCLDAWMLYVCACMLIIRYIYNIYTYMCVWDLIKTPVSGNGHRE